MPKTLTLAERKAALKVEQGKIAKEEAAIKEAVEAVKRKELEAASRVTDEKRWKEQEKVTQRRLDKRKELGEAKYERRVM